MHDEKIIMESVTRLFNGLSDETKIEYVSKGDLISVSALDNPKCFLIHHGYVVVRRINDHLILGKIRAPSLFGYNPHLNLSEQVCLEAMTDVAFEAIPHSQFYQRVDQLKLWEPLLDTVMHHSAVLFRKSHDSGAPGSWLIIRAKLQDLIKEPSYIREGITASGYILQRTSLSRSGVMRYLAKLREKKLIVTENGILLSVSPLPLELR